jgi:hypothetical protein
MRSVFVVHVTRLAQTIQTFREQGDGREDLVTISARSGDLSHLSPMVIAPEIHGTL